MMATNAIRKMNLRRRGRGGNVCSGQLIVSGNFSTPLNGLRQAEPRRNSQNNCRQAVSCGSCGPKLTNSASSTLVFLTRLCMPNPPPAAQSHKQPLRRLVSGHDLNRAERGKNESGLCRLRKNSFQREAGLQTPHNANKIVACFSSRGNGSAQRTRTPDLEFAQLQIRSVRPDELSSFTIFPTSCE